MDYKGATGIRLILSSGIWGLKNVRLRDSRKEHRMTTAAGVETEGGKGVLNGKAKRKGQLGVFVPLNHHHHRPRSP